MIPLFHILTLLDSLFSLSIAAKVFTSYQKIKRRDLKNFLGAFLSLGAYFGLASLPGLVLNNPIFIQAVYIISYAPLYLSVYFVILVFLDIFGLRGIKGLSNFLLLIIAANIVFNTVYFSPATIRKFGQFFYWGEGTAIWLQATNGMLLGVLILFISLGFFAGGIKSKEKKVRGRSLRLGLGTIIFLVTSVVNFVHPLYLQEVFPRFLATILAGVLSFIALGLMFWGVYYKPRSENSATL